MRYNFISPIFLKKRTGLLSAKLKSGAGFTLIELLTVAAIIVILTSIILVNWWQLGQQLTLQRAANKLTLDIRRAGEMAMSTKECPLETDCAGYGIYLEQSNSYYILYADTQSPNEFYTPADDEIEPNIELEKGVVIQDIKIFNRAVQMVSINFAPPSPIIKIKPQPARETNEVVITLASGRKTKTIRVNAAGLAYVE